MLDIIYYQFLRAYRYIGFTLKNVIILHPVLGGGA